MEIIGITSSPEGLLSNTYLIEAPEGTIGFPGGDRLEGAPGATGHAHV